MSAQLCRNVVETELPSDVYTDNNSTLLADSGEPNVTRNRRESRRERKQLDAGASLVALGAFFVLGPLFFSAASPFKRALAPMMPVGFLFLCIGAVVLWLHLRRVDTKSVGSVRLQRTDRAPTVKTAALPDDLAAIREHARNREVRAPDTPTEWSAEVFDVIEWRRFEAVVEELFRQAGFITKSQSHGADGGVDIWLHSKHQADGKPVSIVQCKHWSGRRVGVDKVRELRGVMASHDIKRGQFATTSEFSEDAEAFAAQNGINLLNGRGLLALIRQRTAEQQSQLLEVALEGDYRRPTCVNCGIKMIERAPKGGGKPFWGCQNFPRCRATLQARAAHR